MGLKYPRRPMLQSNLEGEPRSLPLQKFSGDFRMNDLYEITEARMHVYNLLRRIYAAGTTLEFTSNLGNAMLEYISDVESIREGSRMVSMAC